MASVIEGKIHKLKGARTQLDHLAKIRNADASTTALSSLDCFNLFTKLL
jgi:hypothetical protein